MASLKKENIIFKFPSVSSVVFGPVIENGLYLESGSASTVVPNQ